MNRDKPKTNPIINRSKSSFSIRRSLVMVILFTTALWSCENVRMQKDLTTVFEASDSLETATYDQGIAWWKDLETSSPYVSLQSFGETDIGKPLHLVVINAERNFSAEKLRDSSKTVILINNGIHPGEPDGIDASMLFARELVMDDEFEERYPDVIIAIIPFYNVGGALNRNCCSRANQNGPMSYGFRGNAKNLDLNRDFIKCDSKNARSFVKLFNDLDPDVYLETHVSNGADYPYTMTYLMSQPDKLSEPQSDVMTGVFESGLLAKMKAENDDMTPYVNLFGTSPDSGFATFYDSPRYSTGFTALHNSFGLLTETHMLKEFSQRVMSTLRFMNSLVEIVQKHSKPIRDARDAAFTNLKAQNTFPLDWEVDYESHKDLTFLGYAAYYDTSDATGQLQLYYDQDSTWESIIPYYNRLKPTNSIRCPEYYLVPKSWNDVIVRLELNGVAMSLMESDTAVDCSVYRINEFETSKQPYEGHYYHSKTSTESHESTVVMRGGEYYLVSTNQKSKRFMIEVLEPAGPDSYFNWNFFDEILQQKEWFSAYVFDKEAAQMLEKREVKENLKKFISQNPALRDNGFAQLYHLYKESDHYERDRHMIYPVFRIE
ncbi:MAG: hypothetical protein HN542_09620 [Flavobacteriales bacterium]|jgi:hypothetical protein|nr:hypothetical protein [Flavobacteriales bacterium]MBT4705533.1 hypothetical protein [Flavobacteriales bacterium]MBT4930806.1 hypothetical protein [Flavobacteriales bacterium]MBT6384109.1 hypothetical protein [Flavobacteriales bacterium]MBT6917574.1 hypothetical protein [Flavobacteriales bacterium]